MGGERESERQKEIKNYSFKLINANFWTIGCNSKRKKKDEYKNERQTDMKRDTDNIEINRFKSIKTDSLFLGSDISTPKWIIYCLRMSLDWSK